MWGMQVLGSKERLIHVGGEWRWYRDKLLCCERSQGSFKLSENYSPALFLDEVEILSPHGHRPPVVASEVPLCPVTHRLTPCGTSYQGNHGAAVTV